MDPNISKHDWAAFVAAGKVPQTIGQEVLGSWRRARSAGLGDIKRAPRLAEAEFATLCAQARRLRQAAQGAMTRAGYLLNQTGNIVLLCHSSGVILDAGGDGRTLAIAHQDHLHPGGNWAEAATGTNAIGTALYLRRPVQIRGVEHYCEAFQHWNCAATPINDPASGGLLGVLDISWPGDIPQPNTVALSASLAAQIEADLTRMLAIEHETLMEHLHHSRLRRGNAAMLVLDRSGRDILATDDIRRICDNDAGLDKLRHTLAALVEQPADTLAEALGKCLPDMDVELIGPPDETIGVMLVKRPRAPKALPASATKEPARPDTDAELAQIARVGATTAELCAQAQRLAQTDIPILIEGETGAGKTFLARAIHRASPQADGPFELIDCSVLTKDSLRQALTSFHNASTPAPHIRAGLTGGVFPSPASVSTEKPPSGGTLCLNSPGAASPEVQKLLLSLIEAAVGAGMRPIALSNRCLYDSMKNGQFRSDLYYRIAVARLHIAPLRARRDEIAPTLRMILRHHAEQSGGRNLTFTPAAQAALSAYHWPGNLREMSNMIATLDALSPSGLIDVKMLPPEIRKPARPLGEERLRDHERVRILEAIDAEGGNLTRAAKRLGIARSTLYLKLDSYGMSRVRGD